MVSSKLKLRLLNMFANSFGSTVVLHFKLEYHGVVQTDNIAAIRSCLKKIKASERGFEKKNKKCALLESHVFRIQIKLSQHFIVVKNCVVAFGLQANGDGWDRNVRHWR